MTIYNTVVLLYPIGAEGINASCQAGDVSINHGRADPGQQPEASTASITLPLGMVANVEIGTYVQVATLAPTSSVRFVGWVTDMATEWEPRADVARGITTVVPVARIMAAGPLSDSGRRYVGDVPWPQELDGARVARVLAALPGGMVGQVDPGTVQVLARDVDRQAALGLMQEVGNDAAGVVWETKDGRISYADAAHRRGIPIGLTLDACDVLMSPRWSRSRSGLVNDVAVTYGADVAGGQRPVVTATAPASINSYGRVAYSITTDLAAAADATALAQLLMVRNSEPAWLLDGIQVDLSVLDATKTAQLLALDVHSLVTVTGFPAGGPSTTATLWLEGWTEDISYGRHTMSLFVSAYCRTAPPVTWDEVPASWTWDNVGSTKVRKNLVQNPRIGVDLNGWQPYGDTLSRVTGGSGWALGTTTALRATMVDAATTPTYATGFYSNLFPCTPGQSYAAIIQVRSNRAQRVGISLEFYDNATDWTFKGQTWDTTSADVVVLTPNAVATLVNRPFVAPPGAGVVLIGVYPAAAAGGGPQVAWVAGDWLEATNAHIEQTALTLTTGTDPVIGIFHGALPDTATDDYAWIGGADSSASTRTTVTMRTNVVRNPVVGTDTTSYAAWFGNGGAGTPARVTGSAGFALATTTAYRMTWTTGTTDASGVIVYDVTNPYFIVGRAYSFFAQVRASKATQVLLLISFKNAASAEIASIFGRQDLVLAAGVAASDRIPNVVVPAGTVVVEVEFITWGPSSARWNAGDWLEMTNVHVEETTVALDATTDPVTGIFNGGLPDTTAVEYAWTGTAHASTSQRYAPPRLLWDTATCFGGPLPSSGRWADVSASTRWNDVPATTAWDTWT